MIAPALRPWLVGALVLLLRLAVIVVIAVVAFGVVTLWQQNVLSAATTLETSFGRLGFAVVAAVTTGTVTGTLLTHRLHHRTVPLGTRVLHGGILCVPMIGLWLLWLFDG